MATPRSVLDLVERFERNREAYLGGKYNETQLRREFIDPFFKALGWDIDNEQGIAEAYKDVIHEDAIKIGSATKAPDYCFRIGGTRKYFLEAKKPSIDIKGDPGPAYQLRRYAWSAKLPLSILTDFEELAVYDCRVRPLPSDKSSTARTKFYTYTDYVDKWDEIASVFSKDAVLKGAFDQYAEKSRLKKGTAQVDDAFLAEIESWRDDLAHNIALRNPKLNGRQLNFAVQMTIDRLIFLRICEDRGVERYGELMGLMNGDSIYQRLLVLFRKADDRYNSGLFHFSKEKDRPDSPDELTPSLTIDDKVLKDIFKRLYYPDSPYEFSVLPAEILGQVYEQFLGKVITLTSGHRARVEDKPEVKKAGGVFYTPAYIVDYIVQNTVGKLVEGKTPKEVEKIKILDPACGSGSFLLGAYQFLLDWHLKWYLEHSPEQWAKGKNQPLCATGERREKDIATEGTEDTEVKKGIKKYYKLTLGERKKILLNNIFGVDIDTQAVEVTKLSLLLKVLEGEKDLSLFARERALPDLGQNIKCGNSLIGPDFYQNQQGTMFEDDEQKYKINAFDWQAEFKDIFRRKNGGFDAVIGNPPWGCLLTTLEKDYLFTQYVNRRGEAESHLFFIEKAFHLINRVGALGFITPNTWLTVLNSEEIRRYLLQKCVFEEITQLSKYIFRDAPDIVPILIFINKKENSEKSCKVRLATQIRIDSNNFKESFSETDISQEVWQKTKGSVINLSATPMVLKLLEKCNNSAIELSRLCKVLYGIKTGDNLKFLSKNKSERHFSKALKTGELSRYSIIWKGFYLWWNPSLAGYRNSPLEIPKIVVQYIRKISLKRRIIAALDIKGSYYPLNNYSYITVSDNAYDLRYILGLLNSSVINYYFANSFVDYNIKPTYLQQLPVRTIDFKNKADKSIHDKMVSLVEGMLDLHKKLSAAKTPNETTVLQRQIDGTDNQIDRLVYELYGLTEDEIKIVEEMGK